MSRSALSRHLINAEGDVPGFDALTEHLSMDRPHVISDYLNLLSAVWLRRIAVGLSVGVWGSAIWAVLALMQHKP